MLICIVICILTPPSYNHTLSVINLPKKKQNWINKVKALYRYCSTVITMLILIGRREPGVHLCAGPESHYDVEGCFQSYKVWIEPLTLEYNR